MKIALFVLAAALVWNGEKITRSDGEWREKLGRERYNVMRRKATEGAFLGQYVLTQREGIYQCAACTLPLFSSEDKYQAGVGWPTFTKPIDSKNIYYLEDYSLGYKRYEVLCRQCDSHLGHIFNDGPPPKHYRYCVNSIALTLD